MDKEKNIETLTLDDLCVHTGIRRSIAIRIVELGIIEPFTDSDPLIFHHHAILRVKKILRIKRDLKVGFSSMNLVLDLLEKINKLEERLSFHEKR